VVQPDFLEAGASGPLVVLVHSGASGARQWRRLTDDLKDHYRVRAVNLFGYGATPPWPADATQSIADQARLVEGAIPADADEVSLVGHSLGGLALRDCVKACGARGEWETAAERFANYWGGAGSWQAMSPERRAAFAQAIRPNFHEWDAVMGETTPAEEWARTLPCATLALYDPGTVLPIREIAAILRATCPTWRHQEVPGVGHMAPLTRPDVINPIIGSFLDA